MPRSGTILTTLMATLLAGCAPAPPSEEPQQEPQFNRPKYDLVQKQIVVDGDPSDWEGVKENLVAGEDHLWFGQGMTREKWHGDEDASYRWRAAWFENKLYFLFEVTDDRHVDPPTAENSWRNDCIEILLDPKNQEGPRKEGPEGQEVLHGYEIHFLPTSPVLVFLNDTLSPLYPMDNPQNELFEQQWSGEAKVQKTEDGYLVEIGFSVPDVTLQSGLTLGMETGVGDDDGEERKSLQMWTGNQVEFWLTMDHYGKVTLVEE